nr:class I SAM-dependent methyltransferase [Clostridium chromiireducens]
MQFGNDRLRRIERQLNKKLDRAEKQRITVSSIVEKDKIENLDIDYFLFEQKYRGTIEDIKGRQKKYVDIFRGRNNVLDIGCGRGEFVELLTEENIQVIGIDINEDFVEYCKDRGLNVKYDDMFKYLENCEDNSIGGIYCSQVIEHLTPEQMLKFIRLANKKLSLNSPFVLETINPQNLVAVANWFYMDISHIRPVHPLTLEFILESEGFAKIRTLYLNNDEINRLPELKINDVKDSNLDEFNYKLNKINDLLFGAQDYAIVCNKIYN